MCSCSIPLKAMCDVRLTSHIAFKGMEQVTYGELCDRRRERRSNLFRFLLHWDILRTHPGFQGGRRDWDLFGGSAWASSLLIEPAVLSLPDGGAWDAAVSLADAAPRGFTACCLGVGATAASALADASLSLRVRSFSTSPVHVLTSSALAAQASL